MKKFLLMCCAGVLALGLTVQDAQAKRLGGGFSKGMQRESVTQRQATPPAQATPHTPASAPAAAPAIQPQPKRSWLGPLAGLAAGLGIGALMAHLGMGEGMGTVLMMGLLLAAAVFAFRLFVRKAAPAHALQFAGAGMVQTQQAAAVDAIQSPFLRTLPPDFDQADFLRIAKVNFIRLQAAHDVGNLDDIREFTTPEMFAEIKMDLAERQGVAQETNIQRVEAELLDVISETSRYIASVRFHGMISEQKGAPAEPFSEIWHWAKPLDGRRGWVIAGIQQVH